MHHVVAILRKWTPLTLPVDFGIDMCYNDCTTPCNNRYNWRNYGKEYDNKNYK